MTDETIIETEDDVVVEWPDGCSVIEPAQWTNFGLEDAKSKSVLIVLNQKIGLNIRKLWDATTLHICADGGANQLYEHFSEHDRENYIPQFITGDLDSLKDEVRKYYKAKGTVTIPQYTQYATDFNKAISLARVFIASEGDLDYNSIDELDGLGRLDENTSQSVSIKFYVLNGIGGRFDQTIHSIHQLYSLNVKRPELKLFFITDDDVVFLVPKGKSFIKYDKKVLGPVCGLLPLGKQVTLNTWGLKWDVRNWKSDMISQVSSSNSLHGKYGCIIDTTDDFVMNIEWNSSQKKLFGC